MKSAFDEIAELMAKPDEGVIKHFLARPLSNLEKRARLMQAMSFIQIKREALRKREVNNEKHN